MVEESLKILLEIVYASEIWKERRVIVLLLCWFYHLFPAGLTSKILAVAPLVSPFKGHRDIFLNRPTNTTEIAYKMGPPTS